MSDHKDSDSLLEEEFAAFNERMESESQVRDDIGKEVRDINQIQRKIAFNLQKVHRNPSDKSEIESVCASTDVLFRDLAQHWQKIVEVIGKEHPEKYRFMWRNTSSNLVFAACFKHWLTTQELLSLKETEKAIGVNVSDPKGPYQLEIDLEDYLMGVSSLPKELSRFCVNCVRCGNYTMPVAISQFVTDLYSGFRLLNLRNDALRRKFDSIKYDVAKLEEVMYDVSVRKLTSDTDDKANKPGSGLRDD